MTAEEYFKFADEFFGKALEISKAKNSDYTGGSSDPFANFTSVESLHISTEAGFITRMNDKLMRIASFAKQGNLQVKDESVTDTLRDLANYCCLMAGYLESKKPVDSSDEDFQPDIWGLIPDVGNCICTREVPSHDEPKIPFIAAGQIGGYKREEEVVIVEIPKSGPCHRGTFEPDEFLYHFKLTS